MNGLIWPFFWHIWKLYFCHHLQHIVSFVMSNVPASISDGRATM
jgi:hypothetical protein